MKYENIVRGRFLERPNRFIARVEVETEPGGEITASVPQTVHVKNTGRCRELLQKGATVYLERSANSARSTAYDLVAVEKGTRLINMDSQAPNRAVGEWLKKGLMFPDHTLIRPETHYGNSRFDFYIETLEEKIFMEVKGVTLEEDGVVLFPDAPSDRAVKHVEELIAAKHDGYRVFVMFVIQMEEVKYFIPNRKMHPQFADALAKAAAEGVEILAYDCRVTPDSMEINAPVEVRLKETLSIGALKNISKPLLEWYDKNRRVLPWREDPQSYRVWVSEIMLQQTRVEAVKPYFERFMKALPDVKALAEAEEETLLKLWEGLGYYNRVRNLQRAAIQIQEDWGGSMPDTYEELLKLTGVGSYTAGAIASIAFRRPVPAVDGNVLRVLARVRKDERLISDAKVKAEVERELREVMPKDRPGDFNQAMMELGACVCIPNGAPLCGKCPLREICMAHEDGTETAYPRKQEKKPRQLEDMTILVIRDENRTAIRKRSGRGLLAGMYEFPTMQGHHTAEEVVTYLADNGLKVLRIQALEDAKHVFTHREWHMKGYMVRVDELEPKRKSGATENWLYIEPEETREKYPIPSAFGAYTKYLSIKLGKKRYQEEQIK